jgi:MFS family permease
VLIGLLFCFNLLRGISSCAWLPWISALVPAEVRGRYLARDGAVQGAASFATILISGLVLGREPQPWHFAVIFGFSAITGAISLSFLKRIPDAPTPEIEKAGTGRVPWLTMLRHPPFWALMRTVIAWSAAFGGLSTFTVAFLKVRAEMPEGDILLLVSVASLGGLANLWFLGSRLDRLGSKPVITVALLLWLGVMAGWIGLAGGMIRVTWGTIIVLQFLMGVLTTLVGMSANRLAMAIIPVMGRNHFFALFSVLGSVTLGIAPVAWGILIDAVGERHWTWLGLDWNRYTVFFAATACAFAATLILARRLKEPEAASMEVLLREVLVESPQKFLQRFWPKG